MKDFITTIASVLILMMFVMQFAANQASFTKIMGAEHEIRQLRLISENQGMIKSENIAELKEKLACILGCNPTEISVDVSGAGLDEPNGSDTALSPQIEVTMPVYGVVGPARVLGIDPAENVRTHRSAGMIFLAPQPPPPEEETQ